MFIFIHVLVHVVSICLTLASDNMRLALICSVLSLRL